MTTTTTTMTAKEAYEIALNDPIARLTNKSSLEEVIKTISNRTFQIKNAIEWHRFQSGFN